MPATKNKLDTVLICIIGLLICIILVGTVFGLQKKNASELPATVSTDKAVSLNAPKLNAGSTYFELGTIRIVTAPDSSEKDGTGTALVISPWITYPEGDNVFYEELARKKGVIRGIFTKYFSEASKNQLKKKNESVITADLKDLINAQLSLGKIQDLYFTDYIFLE